MPILSSIQRRSPGGRILLAAMYLLLTAGAASMVYPFLLLLSGSVKSGTDVQHFDIIPRYFFDDRVLFQKFEEQRYGGYLDVFAEATRRTIYSFEMIDPPPEGPGVILEDWRQFWGDAKNWPVFFSQMGHNLGFKTQAEVQLKYIHRLQKQMPDFVKQEQRSLNLRPEEWQHRPYQSLQGSFGEVYHQMRSELPLRYFRPTTVEGYFVVQYLRPKYGIGREAVEKLNQRWGTSYASLYDIVLPPTPPAQAGRREDWWHFVKNILSARFIRFAPSLLPQYQKHLQAKYHDIKTLNELYGASFAAWGDVAFPDHRASVAAFSDLGNFVQQLSKPDGISLDSAEYRWRDFLKKKYQGDLASLNRAYASHAASFDEVPMPVFADDWKIMKENCSAIIWDFVSRNYRIVWDYLSIRGRAIQNTLVFCFLNVLTALIVNPMAAYALSRFQPRWGYYALFLLMATMAFPGEVTQIPSFLMLRELGFLNTFIALVIPAAANGYSIFLLKGFFDSLPKDLYESANLDGAGELRIFWSITMPLSGPILAVVALGAFTAAYGAFMFALLVCQKESMWTLMVYIYQLQQEFHAPIVFAALVLAAIPTLLVFVFCQNIIMRGIVVPVEK